MLVVAEAVLSALTKEESKGQIYQIGGPQAYSFADLMRFTLKCVGRRRLLVKIPFSIASLPAALAGLLPNPPLTLDQLKLLQADNVCRKSAPGLADLGINPTAIEGVVPDYLTLFVQGRFAPRSSV